MATWVGWIKTANFTICGKKFLDEDPSWMQGKAAVTVTIHNIVHLFYIYYINDVHINIIIGICFVPKYTGQGCPI